jgi:hypothetical protein
VRGRNGFCLFTFTTDYTFLFLEMMLGLFWLLVTRVVWWVFLRLGWRSIWIGVDWVGAVGSAGDMDCLLCLLACWARRWKRWRVEENQG